jgi:predicted lipoprotein with Yx(FWY)xxD motif
MTLLCPGRRRPTTTLLRIAALVVVVVAGLAACSSSSKSASSGAGPTPTAGEMFSTANATGLGTVVVDAKGFTVYVLSADGQSNVTCDDASGCTKVWPDLPLPSGVTQANAGAGIQPNLLSTMKLSDGETYPTYKGWLMYEYSGDTGPAQSHGQGIQSFGGTWYAINASGMLVMTAGAGTSTSAGASSTTAG